MFHRLAVISGLLAFFQTPPPPTTQTVTLTGPVEIIPSSSVPIPVALGGTGRSIFPAYTILMGAAGTIIPLVPGPLGTALMSNGAGKAPSFQPIASTGASGSANSTPLALVSYGNVATSSTAGSSVQINADRHIDKETASFTVPAADQNSSVWWGGTVAGVMTLGMPALAGNWTTGRWLEIQMLPGCAALQINQNSLILATLPANPGPLSGRYKLETDGLTYVLSH